jgi:hypothetical protein
MIRGHMWSMVQEDQYMISSNNELVNICMEYMHLLSGAGKAYCCLLLVLVFVLLSYMSLADCQSVLHLFYVF